MTSNRLASSNNCTGCSACYAICTRSAVSMQTNGEGFRYPVVDEGKCVHCGLCSTVCPVMVDKPISAIEPECYAAIASCEEVRLQSSSGGVFSVLAETIINKGGCVYGCVLNEHLVATHIKAETLSGIAKMRGSKYVQSDMQNTFRDCLSELKKGRHVLFSGTPCQISGLKSFLGENRGNLVMVDVICHGVPSPGVFERYKECVEKESGSQLTSICFRSKCISWVMFSMSHIFRDQSKNYAQTLLDNPYLRVFLSNLSLRESCHNCRCKGGRSGADITLADFWGIDNYCPEMDDKKGTSAVLLNTTIGRKLFDETKPYLKCRPVGFAQVLRAQPSYYGSASVPGKRSRYMRGFRRHDFNSWARCCAAPTFASRIISKLRRVVQRARNAVGLR